MAKKHIYKTVDVEKIDLAKLLAVVVTGYVLAVDVAKTKFVAAIADPQGKILQLFRFAHPKQTLALLELVRRLRERHLVQVVMEPTGVYGDTVRYQCEKSGCEIFMVRPKHTHDFAELYDGVPSMHDGKAACVLAELHASGRSKKWQPDSEPARELRALVDQRRFYSTLIKPAQGQLEAMMSRWWPGFEGVLDIYQSKTARKLLLEYASASEVAKCEPEALEFMRRVSHGKLSIEKRRRVIEAAKSNLAQPMLPEEAQLVRSIVGQVDELTNRIDEIDEKLRPVVQGNETLRRMAGLVGTGTAASLMALVGNPLDYCSAGAYEKSLGGNLKVSSSGERAGQLAITKRGSSHCRQLMYLAALRQIQDCAITRAWYQKRKCYTAGPKKKAVVAVMRKLIKALWHVARGNNYDPTKLYDIRQLNLSADNEKAA